MNLISGQPPICFDIDVFDNCLVVCVGVGGGGSRVWPVARQGARDAEAQHASAQRVHACMLACDSGSLDYTSEGP